MARMAGTTPGSIETTGIVHRPTRGAAVSNDAEAGTGEAIMGRPISTASAPVIVDMAANGRIATGTTAEPSPRAPKAMRDDGATTGENTATLAAWETVTWRRVNIKAGGRTIGRTTGMRGRTLVLITATRTDHGAITLCRRGLCPPISWLRRCRAKISVAFRSAKGGSFLPGRSLCWVPELFSHRIRSRMPGAFKTVTLTSLCERKPVVFEIARGVNGYKESNTLKTSIGPLSLSGSASVALLRKTADSAGTQLTPFSVFLRAVRG